MFKGGLRLVLLKEETQHLENYFEMQQLRYPDCVFWYFDMEEAAMSWKIPRCCYIHLWKMNTNMQ